MSKNAKTGGTAETRNKETMVHQAREQLRDLADKIATKDESIRGHRTKMLAEQRQVGEWLKEARGACTTAGQLWGEWLSSSPFRYTTQHANNLIAIHEHWATIAKKLEKEKNRHMGIAEAIAVLKKAGVRKKKSKGGGQAKRPRMQVTYKALTSYVEKYPHLKQHISEVMALLAELRLRAGKKVVRVEVSDKPVEKGM